MAHAPKHTARSTAPTIVLLVAITYAAPATAFVKCKMANGKLMFVDTPPPGCVVEEELKNATPAPEAEKSPGDAGGAEADSGQAVQDAADAQAIAARRRIERDLEGTAEQLVRLRQRIANAPRLLPGIYVNTEDGTGTYQQNERRDDAALRVEEKSLLSRIQELQDEFAKLTRELEQRHGGSAPSWWNPTARCRQCP